jgi:hypothetical protein
VRKVGPDGVITTVFGGVPEGGGSPNPAPRYFPAGVAVDREGNLLISDAFHHPVWQVSGKAAPGLLAGQPFP